MRFRSAGRLKVGQAMMLDSFHNLWYKPLVSPFPRVKQTQLIYSGTSKAEYVQEEGWQRVLTKASGNESCVVELAGSAGKTPAEAGGSRSDLVKAVC